MEWLAPRQRGARDYRFCGGYVTNCHPPSSAGCAARPYVGFLFRCYSDPGFYGLLGLELCHAKQLFAVGSQPPLWRDVSV